jgi:hypothetical protein
MIEQEIDLTDIQRENRKWIRILIGSLFGVPVLVAGH